MWRFELKYEIPHYLRTPLVADLRVFVEPDQYTGPDAFYTVKSLYLDSLDWTCFHDKLAGVSRRHKLRVRSYPGADGPDAIKFEVKYRNGNRISKDVATVSRSTYEELLPGLRIGRMPSPEHLRDQTALAAFFAIKQIHAMGPVVNVQFRRQAFFGRSDRHVRVTLDDSLTGGRARDLFDSMPPAPSLVATGGCILEIKVERDLPVWLRHLITKYRLRLESVSKYVRAVASGPFGLDGFG